MSSLSILLSLIIGMPAGFILGNFNFIGKRQLRAVVDTLLALPTVVVGLAIYGFISKRGILGDLGLLFAIPGMVIAQTILVLPIVISLTATAIEGLDERLQPTIATLGAKGKQVILTSLYEARYAIFAAAVNAYGRAVSEVGASMMIGGNIKWHTRTITTAIALETGKGEFAMGIALGAVLLSIALLVNWSLIIFKRKA
ncbi:MAG: ABC transporter permease [Spirochaetes bacterium]|nr:ABC transporter permease [Spirochaetota bacterium]